MTTSRTRSTELRAWGLAALLACVASPALAAPSDADLAQARTFYENGEQLYKEGRYADASVAFEESYRLSERPELLYNLAACEERLGNLQGALDHLNRYRVYASPDEREALERRIVNLERRLAEAPRTAPSPAPAPARSPGSGGRTLAIVGGVTVGVAGATQLTTWGLSRGWRDTGNQDAWDTWRPINLGAGGAVAVGAGLLTTGLILNARAVSSGPGLQVGVGPRALSVRGSF